MTSMLELWVFDSAAAEVDSEYEGVFSLDTVDESDDNIPDLLKLSSDDDTVEHDNFADNDTDWFSEVDRDNLSCPDIDWGREKDIPEMFSVETHDETAVYVSQMAVNVPSIKLYDSRSTCHISTYHDQFETLSDIPPKPFAAANKQCFSTAGIGDLVIKVTNGMDTTKLRLTKVLYLPEVGYTLVNWLP
ncbi:hypothetical protein BD769DRAFT_1396124 [Suillus cothurnatus]|nr:hypothetical protein BD769DRAFT_1396124 [Suillus cothurnatus]